MFTGTDNYGTNYEIYRELPLPLIRKLIEWFGGVPGYNYEQCDQMAR